MAIKYDIWIEGRHIIWLYVPLGVAWGVCITLWNALEIRLCDNIDDYKSKLYKIIV